jgi:hypothetical protein
MKTTLKPKREVLSTNFKRSEDHVEPSTRNWLPEIRNLDPGVRQVLMGIGAI